MSLVTSLALMGSWLGSGGCARRGASSANENRRGSERDMQTPFGEAATSFDGLGEETLDSSKLRAAECSAPFSCTSGEPTAARLPRNSNQLYEAQFRDMR